VPGQSVGPPWWNRSEPASEAGLEAWIARRRNVCDAGVTRSPTELGKVKCVRFGLDILHAVAPGYVQIALRFLSVQTIDSAAQVSGALAFKKRVLSNAKSRPRRLSARPLTRPAGNLRTFLHEQRLNTQETVRWPLESPCRTKQFPELQQHWYESTIGRSFRSGTRSLNRTLSRRTNRGKVFYERRPCRHQVNSR
jgi:hypothetical protein